MQLLNQSRNSTIHRWRHLPKVAQVLVHELRYTIMSTALALSMVTPASVAQSSTNKYQTWEDPNQLSGHDATNPKLQRLLEELTALVDEADRSRAADPVFIEDLRTLIRGVNWPWRVSLINEDFSDGRVASTPGWNILAGQFSAVYGTGLRSVIQTQGANQEPSTNDDQDLATALLNQLLKQANQSQEGQSRSGPDSALIHVAIPISNAFAVRSTLSSRFTDGRFEFELYQGEPRGSGYRLSYSPGGQPSLELLRVNSRGISVIDSFYETAASKRRVPHEVQWTRDQQGEMVVSFDGNEVIRTTDRGLKDPFDGFALANLSGDFSVLNVKVTGMR